MARQNDACDVSDRTAGDVQVVRHRGKTRITIVLAAVLVVGGCTGLGNGGSTPGGTGPGSQAGTAGETGGGREGGSSGGGGTPSGTGTPTAGSPAGGSSQRTPASPPGTATDPRGPDLQLYTLPECSVVPNGALSGADGLTMFVAVRNGGPGTINKLVPVAVSSNTGIGSRSHSAISTGSSFNPLQADLAASAYNRTHRFTITADPDNTIVERDESNNTLTITVRLPARPRSAADVPCTSP